MRYDLEEEYLRAARELCQRCDELLPRVAAAISCDPYDYWIRRRDQASSRPDPPDGDGEWSWLFRNAELDVTHRVDGRQVRIDFAHDNLCRLFTGDGVELFVRHSQPPWHRFPRLAHPLSQGLLEQLAQMLRRAGYLEDAERAGSAGRGFVLSAKAMAYFSREPQWLGEPPP